jgi:hypothetical protein
MFNNDGSFYLCAVKETKIGLKRLWGTGFTQTNTGIPGYGAGKMLLFAFWRLAVVFCG